MSEPVSERSIKVTAEERTHPSVRKLARACIALARLKIGQSAPVAGKYASDEIGGER